MFGISECFTIRCIELIGNDSGDQAFCIKKCIKSSLYRLPEAVIDFSQIGKAHVYFFYGYPRWFEK